ncbi:hypothetical protein [Enterocloster lavalensis]|uniref:hypothetical protein n=1 Tax=Enterocloster lavalensis TaxID=460384 RepID=UPI0026670F34|nr:hypothetical protein [Enterocloster lavalensis]
MAGTHRLASGLIPRLAGLCSLTIGSGLTGAYGLTSRLARLYSLAIGSGLTRTYRLASRLARLTGLTPRLTGLCSLAIGSRLTGTYRLASRLARLTPWLTGLTPRLARLYSLTIGSRLTGTYRLASRLARLHPWLTGLTPRLAGLYSLTIGSGLAGTYRLASGLARLHPWLTGLYSLTIGSRLTGTHRLAGLTRLYRLTITPRLHSLAIASRLTRTHSRSISSGLAALRSLSISAITAGLTARNALSVPGVTAGPATLGSLPICSLPICALAPVLIIKHPCLHPLAEGSRLSASYSALRVFYSFRPGILRFPAANLILARKTALTGPMLRSILRLRSGLCFLPVRSVLRFSVPGRLALFQTVCLQNRRNIGHNRRYPGFLKRRGRRIRLAAVKRTPSGYLLAAVQFIVVIIHLNFLLSLTGTEIPAFSNTPSTGYADSESRLQKIRAALRTQRCFETAAYVPTKRNLISPSAHSISYLTKKYNPPEFPDELHFPKRLLSILRSVQTSDRRFRTWEQRLPRIYSP